MMGVRWLLLVLALVVLVDSSAVCGAAGNCTECAAVEESACTWCMERVAPYRGACVGDASGCGGAYVRYANHTCPVWRAPPSAAQLLFDPASLVALLVVLATLVVGARRSVHSDKAMGPPLDALRKQSWTPCTVLMFACPLLMGSGILILFFFFTQYVYYFLLAMICIASLLATVNFVQPIVNRLFKRRFQRVPQLACLPADLWLSLFLAVSLLFCWASSNYWLFIDAIAVCLGLMALERAVLPGPRYAVIISILMMAYDGFWVYTHFLPSSPTPTPSPTPMPTPTPMPLNTTTAFTPLTTTASMPTPFPTPIPTPPSAMLKLARGVINNRPGCEFAHFAFFRPCFPTLPMLFVFPRWLIEGEMLIGLGDIVLPGLFIAALARVDDLLSARRARLRYSVISLIGYVIGLTLTMVVAFVFRSGQPALIFLIPCTQIPVWITAACRHQLFPVWYGYVKQRGDDEELGRSVLDTEDDDGEGDAGGADDDRAALLTADALEEN